MSKKKGTLLLVDHEGFSQKAISISSHWVTNYKYYLSVFVAVFLLIGVIGAYIIYERTSQHYAQLLEEKQREVAYTQYSTLHQIEDLYNSVVRLEQLLAKKGIIVAERNTSRAKSLDALAQRISLLEKTIDGTPLGRPHPGNVTSHFGQRSNPFSGAGSEVHKGIDFKGQIGDPVRSTGSGIVAFAGHKGGYGNCVIIEHPNGLSTLYAHLSRIHVKPNMPVTSGDKIGEVGSTGRSTGPHLHYEVLKGDQKLNPTKFMKL